MRKILMDQDFPDGNEGEHLVSIAIMKIGETIRRLPTPELQALILFTDGTNNGLEDRLYEAMMQEAENRGWVEDDPDEECLDCGLPRRDHENQATSAPPHLFAGGDSNLELVR